MFHRSEDSSRRSRPLSAHLETVLISLSASLYKEGKSGVFTIISMDSAVSGIQVKGIHVRRKDRLNRRACLFVCWLFNIPATC